MPLKICILETDDLHPKLAEHYGSYGLMFKQLLACQPIATQVDVFNVVRDCYPSDNNHYDAYLVTGSKADAFGTDAWIQKLKAYLLDRYTKGATLIGVCFGHQLLALVFGGKVERAAQGWGVGLHQYRLVNNPAWMRPEVSSLNLLVSHQDQVTQLPAEATLIASSAFCPNAAYCIGNQVLCFQAHPEFVQSFAHALLELRRDQLRPVVYAEGISSLQLGHQGQTVAEWMMRFVTQASANTGHSA